MSNFTQIGQAVADIWPFFDFSRWWLSAMLDLLYACLDHPPTVFGGFCHSAKVDWN